MIINSQNISRAIVELVVKEQKLITDMKQMTERHETAMNLQNMNEINSIEKDGEKLQKRCMHHFGNKAMVMSFAISLNNNFQIN